MSHAFVKEGDQSDDLPERPVPAGPNYITPRGLELLKEEGRRLAEKKKNAQPGDDMRPINRDLRYLEARIDNAIVVPPGSGDEIRFGVTVFLEDETGHQLTYTIVGEDEARTATTFLSWSSPLASAMFGLKVGQEFACSSDEKSKRYKIRGIDYPAKAL